MRPEGRHCKRSRLSHRGEHRHFISHPLTKRRGFSTVTLTREGSDRTKSIELKAEGLSRVDKCSRRERTEMWCRRRETSASRAKVFSTDNPRARPDLATAAAEKVEEPRLTMTINLTDRRPTVRLTDRWEENHRPFNRTEGRKPPALNQRRKKQVR